MPTAQVTHNLTIPGSVAIDYKVNIPAKVAVNIGPVAVVNGAPVTVGIFVESTNVVFIGLKSDKA